MLLNNYHLINQRGKGIRPRITSTINKPVKKEIAGNGKKTNKEEEYVDKN
jgi:hypothetical protein